MASDQYMDFDEDNAEKLYTDLGGGRKLLWSADFGGENPAADLATLEELTKRYLDGPDAGERPFVVRETSAGGTTLGRVVPRASTALGRAVLQAREGYGRAVLVEEPDGELHAIADGPSGAVDMLIRRGGEHATAMAQKGIPMPIQRVPFGSAWLSFEKAWDEAAPAAVADRIAGLENIERESAERVAPARGEEAVSPSSASSGQANEAQVNGAVQDTRPMKDGSTEMEENSKTGAAPATKSYPLTVKRNFIMSDKATGAPVLTDRVSKAGKPYQTCQVTIPGGTHTVQNGKDVDLSGYQTVLFVNKSVADPEKRDVTFYLAADRDVTLFKTDRETGEKSRVTVAAGELSHAVSQSRKAYQQAHAPKTQDRGEAIKEQGPEAPGKGGSKPRRDWHMSAESAAQPATDAQMRKLRTLLEAGAVTQTEVDAVSTKGEASGLITAGLERPVGAPEGYEPSSALASVGAEIPSQLTAVHDERLSRFTGAKIAAAAMGMGWCDREGIQPEDEVVAVAVVTKSMIREMATELGYNEVCEADIAELMRHEFSPDGVWENAFCLDRVEAALGEAGVGGQEAEPDERDLAAQDERLDGAPERD